MSRLVVSALLACVLAGCGSHSMASPNVFIGAKTLPKPIQASNDALPQIVAADFSSDDVRRGQTWSGTIITTTNVASVEVRTNLFTINVPRRAFGDFRFSLRIYDVPPIFIRGYDVLVIARNSAGQSTEEHLPFRIR